MTGRGEGDWEERDRWGRVEEHSGKKGKGGAGDERGGEGEEMRRRDREGKCRMKCEESSREQSGLTASLTSLVMASNHLSFKVHINLVPFYQATTTTEENGPGSSLLPVPSPPISPYLNSFPSFPPSLHNFLPSFRPHSILSPPLFTPHGLPPPHLAVWVGVCEIPDAVRRGWWVGGGLSVAARHPVRRRGGRARGRASLKHLSARQQAVAGVGIRVRAKPGKGCHVDGWSREGGEIGRGRRERGDT